ncbi:hypothetical protein [Schaalia canis]|nr:hypothetical protein [Schaalia canis]
MTAVEVRKTSYAALGLTGEVNDIPSSFTGLLRENVQRSDDAKD